MDITEPIRHPCPRWQRGAAGVGIALLILLILAAALTTALSMSGSAVRDAAMSEEQIAALFVAESGLERAQGVLAAAVLAGTNTDRTCNCITTLPPCPNTIGPVDTVFPFPAGSTTSSFRYTALTSLPSSCIGAACTSCSIQVVGTARGASRALNLTVGTTALSGGAVGCGGGGTAGSCQFLGNGVTNPDWNPDIVQTIEVRPPPAVLLSNMAYLRHPSGGVNANAAGCVALSVSGSITTQCITQWNDESNHSAGNPVVGSRGASALISVAGSWIMKQNLDADSLFAAVGARFGQASGGTLGITGTGGSGSYWNDSTSPGTVANNAATSGQTNNGAACQPSDLDLAKCPAPTAPPTVIPNPPSSGTSQASRSWCYGADTLVFGFSGRSSNNNDGALTSFLFGTAPESTPVPKGTVAYPVIPGFNSQLYSTLRYIYNPDYLSASDASSGAKVTGAAGATFNGTISKNTTALTVKSIVSLGILSVGDVISGGNLDSGTKICDFRTGEGGTGTYIAASDCATLPTQKKDTTNATLTAASRRLYVSNVTIPALAVSDTIFGTNVTDTTISFCSGSVSGIACGRGGAGVYDLSLSQTFGSTPITSNGMTVTTTSSIPPTAGTRIAVRWTGSGSGLLAAGTTVDSSPLPTAMSFKLSARPTTPLSGAQICGGICAFFDHSSANATTNFTIAILGTQQWAAGMTCLKGVDPNNIVGLTGKAAATKATAWHEVVR